MPARAAPSGKINSTKPDGVYGIGEEIYIDIYMSKPVVSGEASWWSRERDTTPTSTLLW